VVWMKTKWVVPGTGSTTETKLTRGSLRRQLLLEEVCLEESVVERILSTLDESGSVFAGFGLILDHW